MYEYESGLRFKPFLWVALAGAVFIAWRMYLVISGLGNLLGSIPPA